MKLALEDEIAVLQETKGLPTGQRCMRLGYPEITLKSLEERFAVQKIAEAQNQQERARVYGEIAARFNITTEAARERFTIGSDGRIEDNERARLMMNIMKFSDRPAESLAALVRADEEAFWREAFRREAVPASVLVNPQWDINFDIKIDTRPAGINSVLGNQARANQPWNSFEGIVLKRVIGFVKTEALDDYMEEAIPQRVLDSIDVAREAGLKNFFVAYPCLKVDQVELRQADPVVFAELGRRWLEIDYWE